MFENVDIDEGKMAVFQALKANIAYASIDEGALKDISQVAIELDGEYMESAGVNEGAEYDEEKAYAHIAAGLKKQFPKYNHLVNGIVDDYMEAWETFLESIGAITWDGE